MENWINVKEWGVLSGYTTGLKSDRFNIAIEAYGKTVDSDMRQAEFAFNYGT